MVTADKHGKIESTIGGSETGEFPITIRLWLTIPAVLLAIVIVVIYVWIFVNKPENFKPAELGLSTLLLFALSMILFINIPWKKLGFKVTKIGVFELEQAIVNQAKDHTNEIAELQTKIDKLESILKGVSVAEVTDPKLEQVLSEFLKKFNRWSFTPLRIHKWGATQPGFNVLAEYSLAEIKESLRRLVANRLVDVKVSKKGNTVYYSTA